MSEWRERGYVPDSDDEEDFEERPDKASQQPSREAEHDEPPLANQAVAINSLPVKSQPDASRSQSTSHRAVVGIPAKSAGSVHADEDGVTNHDEDVDGQPWSDDLDAATGQSPSTAELLQQQLRAGLETCSQILRPTSPLADRSDTDSPLSSPPSSPEALDGALLETRRIEHNRHLETSHPDPRFFAPARTFRPRTSIQNNPYTLEYAKYQQQCRQRGLAPIRPENFRPGQPHEETQVSDAQASSQQASSSPAQLSAVDERVSEEEESQSPVRGTRSSGRFRAPSHEEELPDITDILRGAVPLTYDRQKTYSPSKNRSFGPSAERRESFRVPSLSPGFDDGNDDDTRNHNMYDLPLSPPRSDGLDASSVGRAAIPNINTTITPRPLLTPVLSSGRQPTKRSIVEVSSSSETDSEPATSQRSQSPSDESQRYVNIRRRIKGVLPASWLRLDAKQQTKKIDPRSHASPTRVSPVKGIATRVTSAFPQSTQRMLISDDDSDTTDSNSRQARQTLSAPQNLFDEDDDFTMYEVVEDDAVDAMLPSRSRGPNRYVSTQKQQQRVEDTWVGPQSRRAPIPRTQPSKGSTRSREQHYRRSRPRKKPKRLSGPRAIAVTDAPDLRPGNGTRAPQYLRVAARTERQVHADDRRPTQKFLQLATKQDTRDVNNQMATLQLADRRPRAQMQQRKNRMVQSSRRAEGSKMVNEADTTPIRRRRGSVLDEDLRKLKQSTRQTLNRLHATMPNDRLDVGTSEPLGEDTAQPASSARQSLAYKNRSGRGTFLTSLTTRPAALETLEVASRPSAIARLVQQNTRERHNVPDMDSEQPQNLVVRTRGPRRKPVPRRNIVLEADEEALTVQGPTYEAAITARADAEKNASLDGEEQALMRILQSINARYETAGAFDLHHSPFVTDWAALTDAFTKFLRRTTIDAPTGDLRQRLGFEAIRSCVMAYRSCSWSEDDSILRVLFQRYSENSMLELFVTPNMSSKRKLGQRLPGYVMPESSKTDIDFFLELTAAVLQKKSEAANDGPGTAKILKRVRTLVSCLSPNNGRHLSHDQVLDLEDFVSMANTYSLYTVLYTNVPVGCRPRLSQIHQLIDFTSCHWAICELALEAWVDISIYTVGSSGDVADVQSLASWIQSTILQMYDKLNAIPRMSEERHWPHVASVDLQNRNSTIRQIVQILDRWNEALARCTLASAHRVLLTGDGLRKVKDLCRSDAADEDSIVCRIMHAIEMYASRSDIDSGDDTRVSAFKFVREIISFTLSSSVQTSPSRLRAMTETWFALAKVSVAQRQKSWDEFLTPASANSFSMLSNSEVSRQCQALFLSLIFDADAMYFELDREVFYTAWIPGLVIPQQDIRFEYELTSRILTHDAEVFPMHGLHGVLEVPGGEMTVAQFKAKRLLIVKYVIQCIYVLQSGGREDSQDFMEQAMDINQGRRLLQLMTVTMKTRWQSLSVEYRAEYEPFVAEVVQHLQTYQCPGFELDRWFTDPNLDGFPMKILPLKQMFRRPAGQASRKIDQDMLRSFRKTCMQVNAENMGALYTELTAALSAHDDDIFDLDGNLLVETGLQLTFVGRVLSVYLEVLWNERQLTDLFETILLTLISVFEDYHLRVDAEEEASMSQFLHASNELITSVTNIVWDGMTLDGFHVGSLDRVQGIAGLLRLAAVMVRRAFQMLRWLHDDDKVNNAIDGVCECARALNDRIMHNLGSELNELTCRFFACKNVEADQVKLAVRSDLTKHLPGNGSSPTQWPLQDPDAYEEAVADFQAALCDIELLEEKPTSLVLDSTASIISDVHQA